MADFVYTRRYSMAHRLITDPAGKCAAPHGHNETVTVRLAPAEKFRFGGANALAPFDDIKGRWRAWIDGAVDHAFQLNEADPLIGYFREREPAMLSRLMTFPGDPTTEALAGAFWLKLSAFLAADGLPFAVAEVRIEETPANTIVLNAGNFDAAACGMAANAWPRRADMSINEF